MTKHLVEIVIIKNIRLSLYCYLSPDADEGGDGGCVGPVDAGGLEHGEGERQVHLPDAATTVLKCAFDASLLC